MPITVDTVSIKLSPTNGPFVTNADHVAAHNAGFTLADAEGLASHGVVELRVLAPRTPRAP